jgi:hypothetical protein
MKKGRGRGEMLKKGRKRKEKMESKWVSKIFGEKRVLE